VTSITPEEIRECLHEAHVEAFEETPRNRPPPRDRTRPDGFGASEGAARVTYEAANFDFRCDFHEHVELAELRRGDLREPDGPQAARHRDKVGTNSDCRRLQSPLLLSGAWAARRSHLRFSEGPSRVLQGSRCHQALDGFRNQVRGLDAYHSLEQQVYGRR